MFKLIPDYRMKSSWHMKIFFTNFLLSVSGLGILLAFLVFIGVLRPVDLIHIQSWIFLGWLTGPYLLAILSGIVIYKLASIRLFQINDPIIASTLKRVEKLHRRRAHLKKSGYTLMVLGSLFFWNYLTSLQTSALIASILSMGFANWAYIFLFMNTKPGDELVITLFPVVQYIAYIVILLPTWVGFLFIGSIVYSVLVYIDRKQS